MDLLKSRFESLNYSISKDTVRQDALTRADLVYLYTKAFGESSSTGKRKRHNEILPIQKKEKFQSNDSNQLGILSFGDWLNIRKAQWKRQRRSNIENF